MRTDNDIDASAPQTGYRIFDLFFEQKRESIRASTGKPSIL